MRFDYDKAAATYDDHRRGGGPYMATLARLAAQAPEGPALELGAGTGNNTAAFLDVASREVVALERSTGMLRRGRRKELPVQWVQGDATALPFANDSFTFCYATYFLHHVRMLDALCEECGNVLRPGGRVAFVTVSEDFIRRHPMNRWFPSFATVDLQRFQPIEEVEKALRDAGFQAVTHHQDAAAPIPVDTAYAEKIAGRFISTYDLLPEQEFQSGLTQLRRDAAVGQAGFYVREAVTVTGEML